MKTGLLLANDLIQGSDVNNGTAGKERREAGSFNIEEGQLTSIIARMCPFEA